MVERVTREKQFVVSLDVMDRKTRFLLASKVSEARDINDAIAVFKEAIKNAHDKLPEQVLIDALRAYTQNETFPIKPEYVAKCGIAKLHNNDNRMERLFMPICI
jgi:transposase-like protein